MDRKPKATIVYRVSFAVFVGCCCVPLSAQPISKVRDLAACFFGTASGEKAGADAGASGLLATTGSDALDAAAESVARRAARAFKLEPSNPPAFKFLASGAPGGEGFARPNGVYAPKSVGLVAVSVDLLRESAYTSPAANSVPTEEMRLLAFEVIVGHEFAHIFQSRRSYMQLLRASDDTGKNIELQADFLAGWFMAQRHELRPDVLRFVADVLFTRGDQDVGQAGHHGTKPERFGAVLQGYLRSQHNDNADAAGDLAIEYLKELSQ